VRSIYLTVTTDLSFDQRMIRICTSLAEAGYQVTLVGRKRKASIPITPAPFRQVRLHCIFEKGKLFYAEYNIRLFFYLLFQRMDAICAIDLDTILPCLWVSRIKRIPRIYDAHELFCEMKEIVSRPAIYRAWKWIERHTVPHFKYGYTVNEPIAQEFNRMYGTDYSVIRSIALLDPALQSVPKERYILYQGAVNEGRSFETLIPAMQWVDIPLYICGDGNFMPQARKLARQYNVEQKVIFKGMLPPDLLRSYTSKAYIGITIFENKGLSNYYSLANRFFDYIHAGVPQLCVDYPVYRSINNLHPVAVLLDDLSAESIASNINALLNNEAKWKQLHEACIRAAKELSWQNEEKKLVGFYKQILG
jgi:glycosyltransferase involved in cell wall biosynthesis